MLSLHTGDRKKTSPRCRILLHDMDKLDLTPLSTDEPAYWLSEIEKVPDLTDFVIIERLNRTHFKILSSLEVRSDRKSILIELPQTGVISDYDIRSLQTGIISD